MSILIKDMEMPKSCAKCKLFGEYGCAFIGAVGYALTGGQRSEDCPLAPVPPHGRLIDADALIKELTLDDEDDNSGATLLMAIFLEVLKSAPTILAEEVTEE